MTNLEFEHIYLSTKAKLTSVARQYSRAEAFDLDEQDVVQEAFVALWELSEKGYPIRNPEALLAKITKNICVGRFRQLKLCTGRLDTEAFAVIYQDADRELPDEVEIKNFLRDCLTSNELEYFLMKTEQNMTLDEMAESTGKSKSGIKMAISRGRKKLREKINTLLYEE